MINFVKIISVFKFSEYTKIKTTILEFLTSYFLNFNKMELKSIAVLLEMVKTRIGN